MVDLSAVLGPDTPLIKLPPELAVDTPKVEIHAISAYDKNGPWWAWNWLKLGEHSGTHFDAPIHWISGKDYADGRPTRMPVQNWWARSTFSTFRRKPPPTPTSCSPSIISRRGKPSTARSIRASGLCCAQTGTSSNGSEKEFLNANETGPHTPGPTAEAIQYLISKDVVGWGTETIGTDAGKAGGMEPPFPAHTLMHKANKYGLASLCQLDKLPPKGAIIIAAPLKIEKGTGSPMRALALVPKK